MTHDLRLELRTRNNRLWHLIHDHAETVAEFCRIYKLDQSRVGAFLNLTLSPYCSTGVRSAARTLADLGKMLVEDLFPKDLYDGLIPRQMVAEIPSSSYLSLSAAKHVALPPTQDDVIQRAELREALEAVLHTISPREQRVMVARYGLDGGDEWTLSEVAEMLGVTIERARQIEQKALRHLRHPSRTRHLAPFIEAEP